MLSKEDVDYLKQKIPQWRTDINLFVEEVFKATPTEQQKLLLDSVVSHDRTAVKSGHGTGKTTAIAWVIINYLLCYTELKIAVTAPTKGQLEDALISEVKN